MINQYAVPPRMFGGTRHFDFAKELDGYGVKTTIFASSFNNNSREETLNYGRAIFKKEKIEGVDFIWIKSSPYKSNGLDRINNMVSFCARLTKAMKTASRKPDVIIGSSPHPLAAYIAMRFAKKHDIKFFFEIRDIWPLSLTDLGKKTNDPMIRFLAFLEKKLVLGSDRIIPLMPKGTNYLIENFKIDQAKLMWISNGVNLKNFPRDTKQPVNKVFTAVYAGTLGEANDLESLVGAAAILQRKNYRIEIKLYGDGVVKPRLEEKIKNLKLRNITINNPVPKNELYRVLHAANCLVFTLKKAKVFRYGNPPNKIFDYLAAGRPIVFSSCASNNLIAESESGISVPPGKPAQLAEAIILLSKTDRKDLEKMGKNGRDFVEKHYQVNILAEKMYDLIRETLEI